MVVGRRDDRAGIRAGGQDGEEAHACKPQTKPSHSMSRISFHKSNRLRSTLPRAALKTLAQPEYGRGTSLDGECCNDQKSRQSI